MKLFIELFPGVDETECIVNVLSENGNLKGWPTKTKIK